MLLGGHQKQHLACKKSSDEVLALVICLKHGANDLHTV